MPNTEVKLLSADCSEGLPLVRVGRRHAVYINPHKIILCVFVVKNEQGDSGIAQLVVAHDC